jgi:DNA-binding CsgD family transcriptional regulator
MDAMLKASNGEPCEESIADALKKLSEPFKATACAVLARERKGQVRLLGGSGVHPELAAQFATHVQPGFWASRRIYACTGSDTGVGAASWQSCLAAYGFGHTLVGAMPVDTTAIAFAFLRPRDAEPFGPRSENLLSLLLPFLVSVFHPLRQAARQSEQIAALTGSLNCLSIGAVILREGRILFLNDSARTLLDRLEGRDGVAGPPQVGPRLREVVDEMWRMGHIGTAPRGAARLIVPDEEAEPVAAILVPLRPGGAEGAGRLGALFLVAANQFAPPKEQLLSLYDLTRLEASVVSSILEGRSVAETAAAMRVSVHTVRAYLKRVFVKVGVHRQAALVRLLAGLSQVRPDVLPDGPRPRTGATRLPPLDAAARRSSLSMAMDVVV